MVVLVIQIEIPPAGKHWRAFCQMCTWRPQRPHHDRGAGGFTEPHKYAGEIAIANSAAHGVMLCDLSVLHPVAGEP